ncbi:DnaJ domain [Dillenia turbinata]|uniref:DnaJ domain n=1 Tax=Dillenia turbinata TaxID=194707 RepID=A0AAN8VJR5_9MAGN
MELYKASSSSYYSILGLGSDCSASDIRRAYRKLAMQWHPDKWTKTPTLLNEAKRKFQQIQEAYSVLSDHRKRAMYDAGLYDPNEEDDEGFSDFMDEMLSLMADVRREDKIYSLEELQAMFTEMAMDFQSSQWYYEPPVFDCAASSKRGRWETNQTVPDRGSCLHIPGWDMYGGRWETNKTVPDIGSSLHIPGWDMYGMRTGYCT